MLYAITDTHGHWCMLRNKRAAVRLAHTIGGQVWAHIDVPEISAWDWPTFVVGATRIY